MSIFSTIRRFFEAEAIQSITKLEGIYYEVETNKDTYRGCCVFYASNGVRVGYSKERWLDQSVNYHRMVETIKEKA